MSLGKIALVTIYAGLAMMATVVNAQTASQTVSAGRQSLDDAWWTGPMLAPSAATLPRGHFLIEPYLYDVIVQGQYDSNGTRHSAPHANGFGSLTYMNYGLANRVTVGLIPTVGYNDVSKGPSSGGVRLGDFTVQVQYRITQFQEGHWVPTTSIALQETLPTGKYDRLGNRPSDGFGSGAYTTTLAFYSQTYFWLPNRRILRMRFNVLPAISSNVRLRDASVYGTGTGFRGQAMPGSSVFVNMSWEYSLTRRWVLALDATYRHQGNTPVNGYNISSPMQPVHFDSGSSDAFGLAPAIEYSWKRNLGVLLGARFIPAGRNVNATISPAIAINFVN
jgi:hypothetical protein